MKYHELTSAAVLKQLRKLAANSRAPKTCWDYVLVDDEGRTVTTMDRRWPAILRREELALEGRSVRILCIGYGRVYRFAFPNGPLSPQFILVERVGRQRRGT